MVPLFYGSVDGWLPAQSPLSHLQLIVPSHNCFPGSSSLISRCLSLSSIALMHLVRLSVSETHFWIIEPSRFFFCNPASALFSPTFASSSCFIFSWDSRSVFPISLLTQILTSNFLCIIVFWERSWCGANEGGHILLNQLLFSPGSYWEVLRSLSPQGFICVLFTVISSYTWHSESNCAKRKRINLYTTISLYTSSLTSMCEASAQKWTNNAAEVAHLSRQFDVLPASGHMRNFLFVFQLE